MKSDESFSLLTYVMPSINAPERVEMVCSWLDYQGFNGKVVVVDGSLDNQRSKLTKWSFLDYQHYPASSSQAAQHLGFQRVKTPYVALIGDDDFPVLAGCQRLLNFLQQNKEYGAAHGAISFFDFNQTSRIFYGERKLNLKFLISTYFSGRYDRLSNLTSNSALRRAQAFESNYSVALFYIARTAIAKKANNEIIGETADIHLSEILSSFGYFYLARTMKFPDLFLLRGLGFHRPNATGNIARHTKLDLHYINGLIINYLELLNVKREERKILLAMIVIKRLETYLSQNRALEKPPRVKIKNYVSQQIRRLFLNLSSSNLIKISLINWLWTSNKKT